MRVTGSRQRPRRLVGWSSGSATVVLFSPTPARQSRESVRSPPREQASEPLCRIEEQAPENLHQAGVNPRRHGTGNPILPGPVLLWPGRTDKFPTRYHHAAQPEAFGGGVAFCNLRSGWLADDIGAPDRFARAVNHPRQGARRIHTPNRRKAWSHNEIAGSRALRGTLTVRQR